MPARSFLPHKHITSTGYFGLMNMNEVSSSVSALRLTQHSNAGNGLIYTNLKKKKSNSHTRVTIGT